MFGLVLHGPQGLEGLVKGVTLEGECHLIIGAKGPYNGDLTFIKGVTFK